MGLRRMERRCTGAVDAVGVAGGEMGEDCLDEFGRVDARDGARMPTRVPCGSRPAKKENAAPTSNHP